MNPLIFFALAYPATFFVISIIKKLDKNEGFPFKEAFYGSLFGWFFVSNLSYFWK